MLKNIRSGLLDSLYLEKEVISGFLDGIDEQPQYISLGQNCSTAYYLKKAGLKSLSFPFDWIFSSPKIVEDCIDDGFNKYLDKSLMVDKGVKAGHSYHSNFFNHRNPLSTQEDYEYYSRCCNRFLEDLRKASPTIYIITLINEPHKRPGWASGFNDSFPMPVDQSRCDLKSLFHTIKSIKKNAKFVIVDHYTNQELSFRVNIFDSDVLELFFYSSGSSDGVKYKNNNDDFYFSELIKSLSV